MFNVKGFFVPYFGLLIPNSHCKFLLHGNFFEPKNKHSLKFKKKIHGNQLATKISKKKNEKEVDLERNYKVVYNVIPCELVVTTAQSPSPSLRVTLDGVSFERVI